MGQVPADQRVFTQPPAIAAGSASDSDGRCLLQTGQSGVPSRFKLTKCQIAPLKEDDLLQCCSSERGNRWQ